MRKRYRLLSNFSIAVLISCSLTCQFVLCVELSPGIVRDEKLISKKLFVEDSRIGLMEDIKYGELDPSAGVVTVIAGSWKRHQQGALIVDKFKNVISFISFDTSDVTSRIKIIDIDNDGICEFLSGGGVIKVVTLFSHTGKVLWSYDAGYNLMNAAIGSLSSEKEKKIVLGFSGDRGIQLLDHKGKLIWKVKDSNVWQVAIVDTDGDGQSKIVHSNAGGRMKIRDSQGKILSESKPEVYFGNFSICKWPSLNDKNHAIMNWKEWIYLLNFKGQTVKKFHVPGVESVYNNMVVATPVQIRSDDSPYFAVLIALIPHRSILLLYDRNDNIVYHEILPERCGAVTVLPSDKEGQENLLIGCEGKVWQYEPAN